MAEPIQRPMFPDHANLIVNGVQRTVELALCLQPGRARRALDEGPDL